jgi:hypothetical protein
MLKRLITVLTLWMMMVACCAAVELPPTVSKQIAAAALEKTLSVLGTPYVWGGQSPKGFDCSGLVLWSYHENDPGLRWSLDGRSSVFVDDVTAHVLFMYNAVPVDREEVWPGDLVFVTSNPDYVTHMGMFIRWLDEAKTKFEWVEASSRKKGVVISTWKLGAKNDDKWLVGVGRMVDWPQVNSVQAANPQDNEPSL